MTVCSLFPFLAAVLGVLKVVQEGFRKVALGKALKMEVPRLQSCQANDITKAWQHLLTAIAEALPSLKDDYHCWGPTYML